MEMVEVVIKIPKKCKEFLDNGGKVDWLDAIPIIDAIANGIVLPEGHGKLIDADKAVADYAKYGISHMWDATDLPEIMDECPAIIEADKEKKNGTDR